MVAALDRVAVTWEGTGTSSPITLGSAISAAHVAPTSALDGETVSYLIEHTDEQITEAEWGRGVYTHSGTTLARTEIIGSTDGGIGGSAVNFSAGVKHVRLTILASDLQGRFISALPEGTIDGAADDVMFLDATDGQLKKTKAENLGGTGTGQAYGEISATPTDDVFVLDVSDHNADPAHKTVVTVANDTNIQVPAGAAASIFRILCSHTGCTISITGDPDGRVINGTTNGDAIALAGDGATVKLIVRGSNVIRSEGDYVADSTATGDVDMDSNSLTNVGDSTFVGAVSGQGLIPVSRGAGSSQPTTVDSGKYITTDGAITIPNTGIGDGWFHCTLEIGADTHDITFNSDTLDISAESFSAGEIYSVVVKSASLIRVIGPAGIFTQADFS